MPNQSILDLVGAQVRTRGPETAALVKLDGQYRPVSWAELWSEAERVAQALIAIGIGPGDRVNIVSNTRYEWVSLDLGIVGAGAVTVPIDPSNLADECLYVCEHSGARLVFCEDAAQVGKFLGLRDALTGVINVVQMTGEVTAASNWVMSMLEFLALGLAVEDAALVERRASLGPESILTIIYTSGTTGRPKGVVLTHANMIYEAETIRDLGLIEQTDVQLLFLPLAHSFAKVIEAGWLATGHVLAFAESITTVPHNLKEVRPTIMAGVPRVFEKFYGAVISQGLGAGGLKRKLFGVTLALSAEHGQLERAGKSLGLVEGLVFKLLSRVVLTRIRAGFMAALGGRMRLMLSGGAPLAREIGWFFHDTGIVVLEGYGMTETSAGTTVNLPGDNQIGTVGPALPGTEIEIASDGEILLRGPGIMREYWRDPEATAETIVNGWLHTGDIGVLDPVTRALTITDRKKDLIITAGGKNVSPQRIEDLAKSHVLVAQCVVHGDRRRYLSALLTLDAAALAEFAKQHGISGDYAALTQHPKVRAAVDEIIAQVNDELARVETIKKFAVLEHDFSIETGELTPKLSVKRKLVNSKYGHVFDGFYDD